MHKIVCQTCKKEHQHLDAAIQCCMKIEEDHVVTEIDFLHTQDEALNDD